MAVADFSTRTKRDDLAPKAEPYWFKISKGQFIGYRKGKTAATWVARLGRKIETIRKESADPEVRDGEYAQVLLEVIAWCDREEKGGNRKYLVSECVDDYIAHKKATTTKGVRGWKDSQGSLAKHLTRSMLDTEVRKLTTPQIKKWFQGMAVDGDEETVRKSRNSANRVFTLLKAALNMAYNDGVVDSIEAWKRVKPFKHVEQARTLFLTDEQVGRLLDAAGDKSFHALLKAGVLTGARYGELYKAKVMDLDLFNGTLHLSGKTGERDCVLSDDALAFFRDQAKSKLPKAALLPSPSSDHWKRWEHTRPMQRAVKRAQLPPETVFYSLRHYYISKAVGAGISLLAIARNCGTSVKMIESNYGKFTPTNFKAMMNLVQLGVK